MDQIRAKPGCGCGQASPAHTVLKKSFYPPSSYPPLRRGLEHRAEAKRPGIALTSLLCGVNAPTCSRNHGALGLSALPGPPPCSPRPSCEANLSQSCLAIASFPRLWVCLCDPCVPLRLNRFLFCFICKTCAHLRHLRFPFCGLPSSESASVQRFTSGWQSGQTGNAGVRRGAWSQTEPT